MSDRKVNLVGHLFVDHEGGMTHISDEKAGVSVALPGEALQELMRWLSTHFPAGYAKFARARR